MALNDKILYKKRSKSWLKNKNVSFGKSRQKPGRSQKSCRTTHSSPKMVTSPEKSERMVTLLTGDVWGYVCQYFCRNNKTFFLSTLNAFVITLYSYFLIIFQNVPAIFKLKILNVGKKSIHMGLNSSADVVDQWP